MTFIARLTGEWNFAERKAIFDIHCKAVSGERFIVEMQKAKVKYFKDRSLFYVTFPIRDQAQQGDWNFRLEPIYFVAILDFEYDEAEERRKFRRDVALKDQDGDVFFDKLHFKFLQMPLFNLKENELKTKFDKWCYFLKNLESFDHIPSILNEPIFQKAFGTAELAGLSAEQRAIYEENLIQYWGMKSAIETARETAIEEREIEIAKSLLETRLSNKEISKHTGLTVEQVEALRNEKKQNR
ncbi:Rpn family recombination-promoting nuclease/putative transposase [Hugenholtzia roseola]|uniref:Rpn family recombination-promoting nuclease/putative transposase n=1 Tax=Hugenholtzia roseola TaxID=1002 RepID=UPI00040B5F30|nr:Rpn family recombination-promoting nuclease/putative transposase [Hugenholtzia roseola]